MENIEEIFHAFRQGREKVMRANIKKIIAREGLIIICLAGLLGCGLSPAYRKSQSDYQKLANIAMGGASKSEVKLLFGEPDSKEVFDDKSELWVYRHREDDRTFKFVFTPRGKVAKFWQGVEGSQNQIEIIPSPGN